VPPVTIPPVGLPPVTGSGNGSVLPGTASGVSTMNLPADEVLDRAAPHLAMCCRDSMLGGYSPESTSFSQLAATGQGNGAAPDAPLPAAALAAPRHGPVIGQDGTVELADTTEPPIAQLPVMMAILAILALSMVSAMYARQYLLRRVR
jgi:hypothetical protein